MYFQVNKQISIGRIKTISHFPFMITLFTATPSVDVCPEIMIILTKDIKDFLYIQLNKQISGL